MTVLGDNDDFTLIHAEFRGDPYNSVIRQFNLLVNTLQSFKHLKLQGSNNFFKENQNRPHWTPS